MYLLDTNILRYFGAGHENLERHLRRVDWSEIAIPSLVLAEVLRGRCEHALKAEPAQAPLAHRLLLQARRFLEEFNVALFDEQAARTMTELRRKHKKSKRHADLMIAATALAGGHVVVTRNLRHFADVLPSKQLANWIDS